MDIDVYQDISATRRNENPALVQFVQDNVFTRALDGGAPARNAQNATTELTNQGSIRHMTIPSGWNESSNEQGSIGMRSMRTFSKAGEPDAQISVFYRGLPVSDQTANAFHDLLQRKTAGQRHEVLTMSEIRGLSEAMGTSTVGDNQWTNPAKPGDRTAPAFKMSNAYTMQVDGKTVMAVEGSFVDQSGKSINDFQGIFIDSDGTGKRIQEVFVQTPPGQMPRHSQSFKQVLNSIDF